MKNIESTEEYIAKIKTKYTYIGKKLILSWSNEIPFQGIITAFIICNAENDEAFLVK